MKNSKQIIQEVKVGSIINVKDLFDNLLVVKVHKEVSEDRMRNLKRKEVVIFES